MRKLLQIILLCYHGVYCKLLASVFIHGTESTHAMVYCTAQVERLDILSCYQRRREGAKKTLLKMGQQKHASGSITVAVNKTLQASDRCTAILCTVERPHGDTMVVVDTEERSLLGDNKYRCGRILEESFLRLDDPHVTIEPANGTAWFMPGETHSFVCRGSSPLDGQGLSWYIRDPTTSKIELPGSSSQVYDPKKNENKLSLLLEESYHLKMLFCALDHHLMMEYPDGSQTLRRYGELATSETILLRMRHPGHCSTACWWILGSETGIMLPVFITLLFIAWFYKRRARQLEDVCNVRDIESRRACPPPPELIYDQVYSHRRRPKIPGSIPLPAVPRTK